MAGNPVSASAVNAQIAADSVNVGQFYAWLKKRYIQWEVNCGNSTQLGILGITSASDQSAILNVVNDMGMLIQVIEGTQTTASARSIVIDLASVQGVS